MNEAEFVTAMKQLPERYADRVPDRHLDGMRLMAEGGEWEELIDNLAASLRQTRHPVTGVERDELAALLAYMNLPAEWLDGLVIADS